MIRLLKFEIYKLYISKIISISFIILIIFTLLLAFINLKTNDQDYSNNTNDDEYYNAKIKEIDAISLMESYDHEYKKRLEIEKEIHVFLYNNKIPYVSWRRLYALTIIDLKIQTDALIASKNEQELNSINKSVQKIYEIIIKNDWQSYLNELISQMYEVGEDERIIDVYKYLLNLRIKANIPFEYNKNWKTLMLDSIRDEKINIIKNRISNNPNNKLSAKEINDINAIIKLKEEMLIRNIPPAIAGDLRYYLSEVPNISFIILLLTIILTSFITVNEVSDGSIGLLLLSAYHRRKIFLSKLLIANTFAITSIVFVYFVSILIGGIFYGFSDFKYDTLLVLNYSVISINQFLLLIIRLCLTMPIIFVSISLTFLISYLSKNIIITTITTMFLSFFGEYISKMLISKSSIFHKFWIFSNTTVYGRIDSFYIFTPFDMLLPLVVVFTYCLFFYAGSLSCFERLDINS